MRERERAREKERADRHRPRELAVESAKREAKRERGSLSPPLSLFANERETTEGEGGGGDRGQ